LPGPPEGHRARAVRDRRRDPAALRAARLAARRDRPRRRGEL